MKQLEEQIETNVNAVLFVLKVLGGKADFHKVFKILYFADQKHLIKYGNVILNDNYIAMQNGPVPSMTYDILKALRGEGLLNSQRPRFENYFHLVDRYNVQALKEPDLDVISESEIAALNESVEENKCMDYNDLTDKSHDTAWTKASRDGEINIVDIAVAGGADENMIRYIEECLENQYAELE